LSEYEVKLNSLFNEGNSSIRALSQENDQLKAQLTETRKQLAEFKNQANLLEFENNKKFTIFEQNVTVLGRDNEDLKRRINEYESRLALAAQELERLGLQLRAKNDENGALKAES
jgi:uncharacterized small protein (DUF1192 family)